MQIRKQTINRFNIMRSCWLPFTILLFVLLFDQSLNAQQNDSKKISYTHTNLNPGDALMLVGYWDDIYYMQLYLQRDGDLWEGHVHFPDDSVDFVLEGGWTGENDMLLLEFNEDGEKSGFWQIIREDDHYKATWNNKNQTMQKESILYDDLWTPDVKKDYYRIINEYLVKIDKNEILLATWHDRTGLNQVTVKNPKNRLNIKNELTCLNKNCTDFQLKLYKFNGNPESSLNVTENKNELKGYFTQSSGKVSAIAPALSAVRETRVKTELSSQFSMAVEYPVLKGLTMPARIESLADSILTRLKQEIVNKSSHDIDNAVAERQKFFAFAWFDVFYWDDQFISGKWTIQKSWDSSVSSLTLNFDLEEELPVNLIDQFKPDFDYLYFLDKYKKSECQKLLETKDLLIKNKVSQCTFPNITFNENGMIYTSDFDIIVGELEILVPASELVEQLKNKSKLKRIFVR
jgi:hypothetical protein